MSISNVYKTTFINILILKQTNKMANIFFNTATGSLVENFTPTGAIINPNIEMIITLGICTKPIIASLLAHSFVLIWPLIAYPMVPDIAIEKPMAAELPMACLMPNPLLIK